MVDSAETMDIHHILAGEDAKVAAAMRAEMAPFKGKMNGPEARAPFDGTMEQVPDAADVT